MPSTATETDRKRPPRWLTPGVVKTVHALGLTNLSDEEVRAICEAIKTKNEGGVADPKFVENAQRLDNLARAREETGYPGGVPIPCKPLDKSSFPASLRRLFRRDRIS